MNITKNEAREQNRKNRMRDVSEAMRDNRENGGKRIPGMTPRRVVDLEDKGYTVDLTTGTAAQADGDLYTAVKWENLQRG